MGLDIILRTDNYNNLCNSQEEAFEGLFDNGSHNLSRTFCDFMGRKDVVPMPELNQIGKLLNIDISPIYDMEGFDEFLEYLEFIDDEDQRQSIINSNKSARAKIEGNINRIKDIISQIIMGLSQLENLEDKLWDNDYDTLCHKEYFSDFNRTRNTPYINNNFGQDLRNLERFLIFAIQKNAKTVWFEYG